MRRLEAIITIDKPVKAVWEYIDNPDNMPLWLDNFVRYEHVSGERGQPGSKGRQYYNERGREFVMDEEMLERTDHKHIKLKLTSKPMDIIIENSFKSTGKNSTELVAIAEFTRVSAFMKLMMALFMPLKKAQATHDAQMAKLKDLIENS